MLNQTTIDFANLEIDTMAQNEDSLEPREYEWSFDSLESNQPQNEASYEWDFDSLEADQPEYDFSVFETESQQSDDSNSMNGNPFAGGGNNSPSEGMDTGVENTDSDNQNAESQEPDNNNPINGNPFGGDGAPSGFGNPLAPAEGYEYDFSNVAGEGNSQMQTPWDELLQFEEFDNIGDILGLESNPFAGGDSEEGNPFAGGSNPFAGGNNSSEGMDTEAGNTDSDNQSAESQEPDNNNPMNGNPFAGGNSEGGNPFASSTSFSEGMDTGVGNTDNGNGNNFVGNAEGETGSNNQADGNGNWYFGNENQTNGNGNWYISQERDLPDNVFANENNSFVDNLFTEDGNSITGNNPAFAGGGVPAFAGGGDFSDITGANGNQTEGNGNWYFGENNTTNGNGNWEFGSGNQTEGNANWNLGNDNTITGNGNRPEGDGNEITGNGNQPTGDNNQINGNRVSPEEDSQNIVGNGDRYLLMDSEGNIFVVNNESVGDSQYQFNFELLNSNSSEESATASLDQPFVQNLFSQFANSNDSVSNSTEEDLSQNFFMSSSNSNSFESSVSSNSEDNSENQDSDLNEQLRQSPFGRLFDLPGVDGAEDIFGGLGAPSEGENPFGEGGEGGLGSGNPFAFWDPLTEGNPFTPEDDLPENENIGGGNPFAGGDNPFGGGESGEEGNPFAGGGNPFGGGESGEGESIQSPWDELLQFEEFDSVEDILDNSDIEETPITPEDDLPENENIGGGNPFAGGGNPFGGGESGEEGNPFAGGGNPFGDGDSGEGGNPFAGGGNPFGDGDSGEGESIQSPWDELLQFEEFDSVEDILDNSDIEETPITPEDDLPENENIGGSNPFAGGGNPFGGGEESGGGGNPFAGGANPFTGGDSGEEGNPFAGGGNPFGGGDSGEGESIQSPWDELLQFEEFESVEDILDIPTGENPTEGEEPSNQSPWDELLQFEEFDSVEDILDNSDIEETPIYEFDNTDAISEQFAETPIGDLLDFPGVDSPEDIFSTFGIGEDANSENLFEDWNPFTDGNPFVVGDENESEPVYNADGDRILEENQFGHLIEDSESNLLFLSTDDIIDESDIEIGNGGFSEDLFGVDQQIQDSLLNDVVELDNPFLEGQELVIEIDNGYLVQNSEGELYISSDNTIGQDDIYLGGTNPFAEEISQLWSSNFDDVFTGDSNS